MKISVVVPYFAPLFKQNEYGLCKALSNLGHEVQLLTSNRKMKKFYFDAADTGFGERVDQEIDGFTVIYLPTFIDFLEQPFMPSLVRVVKSLNPEVVHVHEDFQNCSLLALLAARESSTPLVLSEERYYSPGGFLRLPYTIYSSTLGKIIREEAEEITAHSNAAKDFLVSLGTDSNRVKVIPVGVDPEEFKPSRKEILTEKVGLDSSRVILTVARLHPNKGLTYLLQAMSQLIKDFSSLRLVILGRGPQEDRLRGMISQLELESHVVLLTEPIPNKEMNKIYPRCDIFVLPSVKEPFGRALLEAMACGKPVVATRVGGPQDIVENGKTGYLVDQENTDQLAKRIGELLSDRKKRRDLGRAGRGRVLEEYDWGKIVKKYVHVYELASSRS